MIQAFLKKQEKSQIKNLTPKRIRKRRKKKTQSQKKEENNNDQRGNKLGIKNNRNR